MDEQQGERFEAACVAAGARFSGGVFACAALAERELTNCETFDVVTTTDTRRTPTELRTTGWFTGLVPITVPVASGLFDSAARVAQISFDSGKDLATVPFDRVLSWHAPKRAEAAPAGQFRDVLSGCQHCASFYGR